MLFFLTVYLYTGILAAVMCFAKLPVCKEQSRMNSMLGDCNTENQQIA